MENWRQEGAHFTYTCTPRKARPGQTQWPGLFLSALSRLWPAPCRRQQGAKAKQHEKRPKRTSQTITNGKKGAPYSERMPDKKRRLSRVVGHGQLACASRKEEKMGPPQRDQFTERATAGPLKRRRKKLFLGRCASCLPALFRACWPLKTVVNGDGQGR